MKLSDYITKHECMAVAVVFAMLAIYHMVFMCFGLDLRDEGFYYTFYQNIFTHPAAVEYNFMYYLTGPIGGMWVKAFPDAGLLGLRVLGLLFMLASTFIAFRLLRSFIGVTSALLGCAIVSVAAVGNLYAFGNVCATIFFYVVMFRLMLLGVERNRLWLFLLSGIVAGLNCFVRIPNLLGIGSVAIIALSAHYGMLSWRRAYGGMVAFVVGVITGVALVSALQVMLGHEQLFLDNIKALFSNSANSQSDSSHSFVNLLRVQAEHYIKVVLPLLALAVLVVVLSRMSNRDSASSTVKLGCKIVVVVAVLSFMLYLRPVAIVWCAGFVGAIYVLWNYRNSLSLVAWAGLFMLVVIPCGSDVYFNLGALVALLSLPLALYAFRRYKTLLAVFVSFLLLFCLVQQWQMSYLDRAQLPSRCVTMKSPLLHGIHTQRYRAEAIDEVLDGISSYVQPGDTLLVFANAPLLNSLTNTVPALGASWPGLLDQSVFEQRLLCLPKVPVLVQTFLGDKWEPRRYDHLGEDVEKDLNTGNMKLHALDRFLIARHYKLVYQTEYFSLYK